MIIAEYFNKEPFVLINAFPSPRERSEERLRGRNEVTGWDEGRLSAVDMLSLYISSPVSSIEELDMQTSFA